MHDNCTAEVYLFQWVISDMSDSSYGGKLKKWWGEGDTMLSLPSSHKWKELQHYMHHDVDESGDTTNTQTDVH